MKKKEYLTNLNAKDVTDSRKFGQQLNHFSLIQVKQ